MRLLKGRFFNQQDQERSAEVVIINEALANTLFPGQDAVGKRLQGATPEGMLIVGVVSDVRQVRLTAKPSPELYAPVAQSNRNLTQSMTLMVKTAASPSALTSSVRQAVLDTDAAQPVYAVKTLDAVIAESVSDRRLNMLLLSALASVALFLAVIGLYGVMSSVVAQHTREIGIRLALGAQRSDVLKLVVGQGLGLTLIGLIVGLAGSFALTRLMANLLFGVTATDPLTFVGVSILLIIVALLSCCLPAHRAAKIDPMVALRHE
jgi:putative ABC transport system permease protein